MIWNPIHTSLALFALCLLGPQAVATQDPEPDVGPTPIELPGMVDQAQEEILQLFRDIEQNLRKVDVLLSDAGAGDTQGLAEVEEAGIGRLLEDTRDRSQQVLQDIDRLLEIAQEMGQQNGGSGSGQSGQPQPGDSSGSRGTQTTQREQTPETPGEEPAGQDSESGEQPDGQQPGSEEPQPNHQGERPTDGQDPSNTDPNNRPGSEPPSDPTGAGSPNDPASDRWGDLPVHVQDVFRGEDSEEMPPRYREWIDAYYRRLNERGGR